MKRLTILLSVLFSTLSCGLELEQIHVGETCGDVLAEVRFHPYVYGASKSSISPNENLMKDLNVYAFRGGMLISEVYVTDLDDVVLELPAGYAYNIYAVANMGRHLAPACEDDFTSELKYSIGDISELDGLIPMSCFCANVHVGKSAGPVALMMERKVAKVTLSVDKSSLLKGLLVHSVRLCQCASVLRPFKWDGQGGSRAETADETIDGDYATDLDLECLNSGENVDLYALENCQGILLPGNDDPFLKVPSMLDGKDDVCTYFEIDCSFDGSGLLGGDVSYRIFVGLDDCTSFDVPGNSCINVSLSLTSDGLKEMSWKVDADVHVMDGYARGVVLHGMHPMSELYVGELLEYQVEVSDALLKYLGGSAEGCTLRLVRDGAEVSGIQSGPMTKDGPFMNAEVACLSPAYGELHLYSPDGKPIGCLEKNVVVSKPYLVVAEHSEWMDDEAVEYLTYIPECDVNGEQEILYLYFTDVEGCNLNGCSSYGFDNSLFSMEDAGTYTGSSRVTNLRAAFNMLPNVKGNAGFKVRLSCLNDGSDHDANLLLTELYAREKKMWLNLYEKNFGLSADAELVVGINPITLTLVDNGWAKYHDSQLSLVVQNSSNLPLNVSVWELMATNAAAGSSDADYIENNLKIDQMQFITGGFYNDEPIFYASYSGFYSERNDNGDHALMQGDKLIYPLEGISTYDLIKAVNYGRRGNGQMIHMLDVRMAGRTLRDADIVLNDNVSNGSGTYDYIYYDDSSWNYKGASLYSDGNFIYSSGTWKHQYTNVSPLTLDRMRSRYEDSGPMRVEFLYAPNYGNLSVMTYTGMGSQYGLTLSFEYSGTMKGYVQTYPSGTWFSAQDNYCNVAFAHSKAGVPLREGGQFVWADDGQLKDAMDAICEFTYLDSPRPLGSEAYLHRAHPIEAELDIRMLVEGEKGKELYPYYVTWEEDNLEYYHQQDAKTYKCAMNASAPGFSVAIVSPRK